MTRAEYEACQARDEQGFRSAIQALTQHGLENGLGNIDYKAIVGDEWRRGNVGEVIDRQVDQAISEVREETSWIELWQTLASNDKAKEIANTAAERVYRSEPIKAAIAGIATGVGKEIGKSIELATIDTGGPAAECMRLFVGGRYGTTIAGIVATGAGKEYSIDPAKGGVQVSTGEVLLESTGGIAGAVVLVVRRQISNMASRLGQRLVGSVLGRLVAVVAGGIGLALIAKDVWDFRYGVLPIVASEMKSKETKEKVQEEIAKSISEHTQDSVKAIAEKTAERVVEIWLAFRRAHAKVVELAGRQEAFKHFLDTVNAADLAKLDEIVGIVLASEGEAGVVKRLEDGTLHRAVSALPPGAIEIAREDRSLETALKWEAIAGANLPKVVEYEIYRRAKPGSFTKASLNRLLGLQDKLAITRLAALSPAARVPLFELDTSELRALARSLSDSELDSLSRYLTGLDKGPAQRVLHAVAQTPSRMAELAKPGVQGAILASSDQAAAVGMMLQASSLPDVSLLLVHTRLVLDGRVSPWLLWAKHPLAVVVSVVALLVLLLLLRRLLFGTRPKIIVQHAAGDRGRGRS
jgi:nitrogen regulatory protein PII-like uncharacterized protein